MERTLLSPKRDIVFQNLFGKIGNEAITKDFMSSVIGREIEGLSLDVTKILGRQKQKSKLGILDVRAKFSDGTNCNIELQLINYHNMTKRMLYYWSRLYGMGLGKNENYNRLNPTISILISDYALEELKDIKESHTPYGMSEKRLT